MAKERKRERINPTIPAPGVAFTPQVRVEGVLQLAEEATGAKSASKIPIIGDSPSDGGIIVHTHPKISTRIF